MSEAGYYLRSSVIAVIASRVESISQVLTLHDHWGGVADEVTLAVVRLIDLSPTRALVTGNSVRSI